MRSPTAAVSTARRYASRPIWRPTCQASQPAPTAPRATVIMPSGSAVAAQDVPDDERGQDAEAEAEQGEPAVGGDELLRAGLGEHAALLGLDDRDAGGEVGPEQAERGAEGGDYDDGGQGDERGPAGSAPLGVAGHGGGVGRVGVIHRLAVVPVRRRHATVGRAPDVRPHAGRIRPRRAVTLHAGRLGPTASRVGTTARVGAASGIAATARVGAASGIAATARSAPRAASPLSDGGSVSGSGGGGRVGS